MNVYVCRAYRHATATATMYTHTAEVAPQCGWAWHLPRCLRWAWCACGHAGPMTTRGSALSPFRLPSPRHPAMECSAAFAHAGSQQTASMATVPHHYPAPCVRVRMHVCASVIMFACACAARACVPANECACMCACVYARTGACVRTAGAFAMKAAACGDLSSLRGRGWLARHGISTRWAHLIPQTFGHGHRAVRGGGLVES